MMSTLAVQEAMGMKVDREAVATLVLPQLWAMSMGPLLSVSQFKRFMDVIRKLGDRVEKEHDQYLRDTQRIEDRSSVAVNGATTPNMGGTVDFESLVGGSNGAVKPDTVIDDPNKWEDDVWGSIFNNTSQTTVITSPVSSPPLQHQQSQSLPSSPKFTNPGIGMSSKPTSSRPSRLGANPVPSTSFNSSAFSVPTESRPSLGSRSTLATSTPFVVPTPPLQPTISAFHAPAPNYNISLNPTPLMPMTSSPPLVPQGPSMGSMSNMGGMGGILAPSKPSQPSWPTTAATSAPKQLSKDDWGDFDPLA